MNECASRGFKFSGSQWEKECWCGDTYNKHGHADNVGHLVNCIYDLNGFASGGSWSSGGGGSWSTGSGGSWSTGNGGGSSAGNGGSSTVGGSSSTGGGSSWSTGSGGSWSIVDGGSWTHGAGSSWSTGGGSSSYNLTFHYVGCFQDKFEPERDLSYHVIGSYTPLQCMSECA